MESEKEKVPGFFLIEDANFVKKMKGPRGIEKLKKLLPSLNLDKLSPVRKYPLTQEIEMLRATAKGVYGDDSPASWEKLGHHDFETVRDSSLGKILLSLWGNSFVNLVKNGSRLFFFFAPFVKFTYENLTEQGAIFTVENNPYPKEYYLGLFKSIQNMVKAGGEITVTKVNPKKHVYRLKY